MPQPPAQVPVRPLVLDPKLLPDEPDDLPLELYRPRPNGLDRSSRSTDPLDRLFEPFRLPGMRRDDPFDLLPRLRPERDRMQPGRLDDERFGLRRGVMVDKAGAVRPEPLDWDKMSPEQRDLALKLAVARMRLERANGEAKLPELQPANGAARAQAAQPPPPSAVDRAESAVRRNLDQSGFLGDVTHDELLAINRTIGGLKREERNELIGRLSDEDLAGWAAEANSWAPLGLGGLSDSEKRSVFHDLAAGLDGKQLARVHRAFADDADAMRRAIELSTHSDATKRDLIHELAAGAVPPAGGGHPGRVYDEANRNALTAARVLGSMTDGQRIYEAVQRMNGDQLRAVTDAAVGAHVHGGYEGGAVLSYNAGPLRDMLNKVSTIDAAGVKPADDSNVQSANAVKARVFEASARELREMMQTDSRFGFTVLGKQAAIDTTLQGMTKLLSSDTVGMTRQLERQDRSGFALTDYARGMMEFGGEHGMNSMRGIVSILQTHGDPQADRAALFAGKENNELRHAQTLGYFMGAVQGGLLDITNDAQRHAQSMKMMFGAGVSITKDATTANWLTGAAGKTFAGVAAAGTAVLGMTVIDEITRDYVRGHKDLARSLAELSFPRLANGDLYNGVDAETVYDSARVRVVTDNNLR